MRRIDPVSLQLFLAAVREGSIKRAAEAEHIAQSALSRRISDLEHELGVQLLVRSPHGVQLTEAGQRAFALGSQLNDALDAFVREVHSLGDRVAGTVRLFANPSSIVGFLPEKLQAFRASFPLVEIKLQERSTTEVLRACLDDRADVGVGVAVTTPRGVESWHFANDPLIVVLPPNHPLAKQRGVRFTDALRFPIVGIQSSGSLDSFLHEQAERFQMQIQETVAVTSFEAACRMVEAGLGIAFMTASAVSAYAGTRRFVRRPLNEPWSQRELRVYSLKKTPRLRSVEALISALTA